MATYPRSGDKACNLVEFRAVPCELDIQVIRVWRFIQNLSEVLSALDNRSAVSGLADTEERYPGAPLPR